MTGRILIVDDEAGIRELCRRILSAAHFTVDMASSADEALEKFKAAPFDFVLTDITMPGTLNGQELLAAIKQRSADTDVVIMTAFPTFESAISTLKNGAYDYLIKPFDKSSLLAVVERCFEKRRLSEELNQERLLRKELEAAYQELQKVEKMKEAFLARLSHEMRTPFTSVFFLMDEIQSNGPAEDNRADLSKLREGIDKVWELVENLLLFADLHKNTAGETLPNRQTVDVSALVKNVSRKFQPQCDSKKLKVILQLADAAAVDGDASLLGTAVKHLFLNAIYFNKSGGEIRVETAEEAGWVRLSVFDTGIGIPEDKQSMIFDGFYQVAEYLTREVGGLGLGLAVVRRIVEAHGGQIKVLSRQGQGSEFRILLPPPRAGTGECAA